MSRVVLIAGSPAATSGSTAILEYVCQTLRAGGFLSVGIQVRDLPAEDLIYGNSDSPVIQSALLQIEEAAGIVVATPIYRSSYTGLLKTFLDLLPQNAFKDKVVLPIATGGNPVHQLALDFSLKPVLQALGAVTILKGIYISDSQVHFAHGGSLCLEKGVDSRLHEELESMVQHLSAGVVRREAFRTQRVRTPLNHLIDYPVSLDDYMI